MIASSEGAAEDRGERSMIGSEEKRVVIARLRKTNSQVSVSDPFRAMRHERQYKYWPNALSALYYGTTSSQWYGALSSSDGHLISVFLPTPR